MSGEHLLLPGTPSSRDPIPPEDPFPRDSIPEDSNLWVTSRCQEPPSFRCPPPSRDTPFQGFSPPGDPILQVIISPEDPYPGDPILCVTPPSHGHPLLSAAPIPQGCPPFHRPAPPWWGAEEKGWKYVLGAWRFKVGQELPHSIHCSQLLPASTRSPGFYYIILNIIKALKTLP